MKKIFLLFLFPFFCLAQNTRGIVISKTNKTPIDGVNILNLQNKTEIITDENGEFSLKLSDIDENDVFEFSHLGFSTAKFSLKKLKELDFKISLSENMENLSGLTITTNQRLKSKITFNKLTPLQYSISSFGSLLLDDKIYIIGGDASFQSDAFKKLKYEKPDFTLKDYVDELKFANNLKIYKDKLLIYDIKTDIWQTSELKFKKRAYHNVNYYNNTIYAIGGKRASANGKFEYLEDHIEVLDLNKQAITIDKTNPHQAINFASFTYKDNIIVMGGSTKMAENGTKQYSNQVHLYNINSGYWYQLADMPVAKETSGVLIDNKIYLVGGNNGKPLSDIETFDLTTEKWETEGQLYSGLEKPAVNYHGDIIYFFENRKIGFFNIKSKELKQYTIELALKSSSMHYYNNKLYIIGGYTENNYSQTPSANVYNISLDEFNTTQPDKISVL